jgi:hypothetical protein
LTQLGLGLPYYSSSIAAPFYLATAHFARNVHKPVSHPLESSENIHTPQNNDNSIPTHSLLYYSSCRPLNIASNTSKESPYSLLSHRVLGSRAGEWLWQVLAIFVSSGGLLRSVSTYSLPKTTSIPATPATARHKQACSSTSTIHQEH